MQLDLGPHRGVRSPFVIDGTRCAADRPAPVLGEGEVAGAEAGTKPASGRA